jgi:hypothetical protein
MATATRSLVLSLHICSVQLKSLDVKALENRKDTRKSQIGMFWRVEGLNQAFQT